LPTLAAKTFVGSGVPLPANGRYVHRDVSARFEAYHLDALLDSIGKALLRFFLALLVPAQPHYDLLTFAPFRRIGNETRYHAILWALHLTTCSVGFPCLNLYIQPPMDGSALLCQYSYPFTLHIDVFTVEERHGCLTRKSEVPSATPFRHCARRATRVSWSYLSRRRCSASPISLTLSSACPARYPGGVAVFLAVGGVAIGR